MKYLYTANYKTLMKEINKDTNNWKDIPHSWVGKINFAKMFNSTQSSIQIKCNSIKILMVLFTEIEQTIHINKSLYGITKDHE